MIIDATQLPSSDLHCDVAIVGSGAAGIPLACELLGSGLDVILVEAGGKRARRRDSEPLRGEVLDPAHHGPLDFYRRRCLGGTTTVWGGRCAPLDPIDFEKRSYIPESGWPLTSIDLDPYYARAHRYHDLGAYAYDVASALPQSQGDLVPGFRSTKIRQDALWRFSLPTNMARKFGGLLRGSSNIRVLLHANCIRVKTNHSGSLATAVRCASPNGTTFDVHARHFVLAGGGLETTRLLLVSRDAHADGIGNTYGLLGRYYGSHVTGDCCVTQFAPAGGSVIWDYERDPQGVYVRRVFSLSDEEQRRLGLPNFRAILAPPSVADPSHRSGLLSAVYLAKRFLVHRIPPEYDKALAGGMTGYQHLAAHARNVLLGSPQIIASLGTITRKRLLAERKLPSILTNSPANEYNLHFDAEQTPNRESRVTLSRDVDGFGVNRLQVDWRYSEADIAGPVRSLQILGEELAQSRVGAMQIDPDGLGNQVEQAMGVGSHHIGTTRMALTPKTGVVDPTCSVHGVGNLFVASSSVFPTTGVANPTLTITALAIRIADHLRQQRGR
jgi:choline dehydrogenase-like flavoprotein